MDEPPTPPTPGQRPPSPHGSPTAPRGKVEPVPARCGHLAELRWPEIAAAAAAGAVVVVPTGSLEQHGPHLPVRTDTSLVSAVCEGAVSAARQAHRADALLAPTLWLGASHHHLPFFAASIDERTYVEVVTQLAASLAASGFTRLFFVNGHGGNAAPLRLAVNEIRRRCPGLLVAAAEYWALAAAAIRRTRGTGPGGAAHACEVETSLMLHLHPASVDMGVARPSWPQLPPLFVRDLVDSGPVTLGVEWDALSADGTMGDPTQASEEKGEVFLRAAVAATAEAVAAFARLDPGALRGGVPVSPARGGGSV